MELARSIHDTDVCIIGNQTKFEPTRNVQQVMVLRFIADDKLAVALAESAIARDVLRR